MCPLGCSSSGVSLTLCGSSQPRVSQLQPGFLRGLSSFQWCLQPCSQHHSLRPPAPFVPPNSSQSLTPSHGPVTPQPQHSSAQAYPVSLTWLALGTKLQKCFTQSFCFPLKRLSILLKYFCTAQDLQARKHVLIILLKIFSLFYLLLFTYGLQQSTIPNYSSELLYFSS